MYRNTVNVMLWMKKGIANKHFKGHIFYDIYIYHSSVQILYLVRCHLAIVQNNECNSHKGRQLLRPSQPLNDCDVTCNSC